MNIDSLKRLYFVGIGGIGMSALARYFNGLGIEVFGYDRVETTLTKNLVAEGMQIHYEDRVDLIPEGIDMVVFTPAIPKEHKELQYFRANNFIIKKRAEVLGIISRNRKAIGVAGTHGKTTTSAILTHVLKTCEIDCTAFLGGIARNFESNFVEGSSEWVVMEADEFDRSFLQLNPDVAVITSMDADHLDIYGDQAEMHKTFYQYIKQVKGQLYYRDGLPIEAKHNEEIEQNPYGLEEGIVKATNVHVEDGYFVFDWSNGQTSIKNLKFTLPGQHNVSNATAAIAVAKQLGGSDEKIREALLTFKGIQRRFEFVVREGEQVYIDDYAHHPTELEAAILAAKTLYPNRKITGVFQPHLYSRTQDFVEGFAAALDALDEVILLGIYPARELPIEGVTSKIIFDRMKNPNKVLIDKGELINELQNRDLDVLMTLGAGDVGAMVSDIKKLVFR
ncbi:MAG: UDP-N-acetylmuramate--L-alanine ligase [Aureispira sp.]|nr:UDP-N-acetylmuramate--L-alanine ligase [Aureispira sp.]